MSWLDDIVEQTPEAALFASLSAGYLIGKIKIGQVKIGGICGTLIMALVIGQIGVDIPDALKNTFFALFIFSLGFTAGPQFFAHLNRAGLRFGILSAIEMVTVVTLIIILAKSLDLDVGTASGMLAGAATESAVVGTATEAIGKLDISDSLTQTLQNNVASAYTISYLFGLITIVLFTSQVGPALLRFNLRESAAAIWAKLSGGLEADETHGLPELVGRTFEVQHAVGQSVHDLEAILHEGGTVERVRRGGDVVALEPHLQLQRGDLVLLVGRREEVSRGEALVGPERADVSGMDMALTSAEIVVLSKDVAGKSINDLRTGEAAVKGRGTYLTDITRMEQELPPVGQTDVRVGDVLTVVGAEQDVNRVAGWLGTKLPKTQVTDFIYIGLGLTLGVLVGHLTLRIGDIPLSLGTGGGCLFAGLLFGWYRARRPTFGAFPSGAAQVLKDLGLAVFIASVGLNVGDDFGKTIEDHGALLPLSGIGMVLAPALISLYVGHKLLKIQGPILMGAIAGQQCSTPAISSVTGVTGNTIPMLGYTITYVFSSVLLPLTGPIVVGIIGA